MSASSGRSKTSGWRRSLPPPHEPLRARFDELLGGLQSADGSIRAALERVKDELGRLEAEVGSSKIHSGGMTELAERASRTRTALQHWLDVDSAMAGEDFPDANALQDRLRLAAPRWPRAELPPRVEALSRAVIGALDDPLAAQRRGEAGYQAVARHRGSAQRSAALVMAALDDAGRT